MRDLWYTVYGQFHDTGGDFMPEKNIKVIAQNRKARHDFLWTILMKRA